MGVGHSSNTKFKFRNSSGVLYSTATIGSGSSRPAPFDFDGDGKTDAVVFNTGTWSIKQSLNGAAATITGFGQTGDIPVPGDWVGSSAADAALYRPSTVTGIFAIRLEER